MYFPFHVDINVLFHSLQMMYHTFGRRVASVTSRDVKTAKTWNPRTCSVGSGPRTVTSCLPPTRSVTNYVSPFNLSYRYSIKRPRGIKQIFCRYLLCSKLVEIACPLIALYLISNRIKQIAKLDK